MDEMYTQGMTASSPIDPNDHLHRLTLPRGSSIEDLWALVSELHAEPLDRSAPMWMAYLIDGLDDDRCALYIKIHHVVVDGVAGLKMISDSLTDDADRREMPPFYATTAPANPRAAAAATRYRWCATSPASRRPG
jgi:hypothetical protein